MGAQVQKKNKNPKQKGKPTKADRADRYALYLRSVQAPDYDVEFFDRVYRASFGATPRVLREDFCGTAAVCCEWAKSDADRLAYGVDIDPEPLAWGTEKNLSPLSEQEQERVHLIKGDVRTTETEAADVLAAQNFSYFCFKTRDELRSYFEIARSNLKERGAMIVDLFGGAEVQEDDHKDVTDHGDFEYIWDQERFDPVTHHARFHIHFKFKDKSKLKRAFTYDWRLWTIPEVRELMTEAGFTRTEVYWEGTDPKTDEGSGEYEKTESGEADPAWNAYVVGIKE